MSTYTVAMSSPRATLLIDVALEIGAEIFQCALQGFGGARRKCAKGVARRPKLCLKRHLFQVSGLAVAFFHRLQDAFHPSQPAPARCAPAAGFLREKAFQIPDHADGAGLVVEHDHRCLLYTSDAADE